MKRIFLLALIVSLTACQSPQTITPTTTPTTEANISPDSPTVSYTPTFKPILTKTPTPRPTPTQSLIPMQQPLTAPLNGLPARAIAQIGKGKFTNIIVSPDEQYIAVSGSAGVRVYLTATMEELWFQSTGESVDHIAISSDGRLAGTDNRSLFIWNIESGELLLIMEDMTGILSWSPDNTQIFAAQITEWNEYDPTRMTRYRLVLLDPMSGSVQYMLTNDYGTSGGKSPRTQQVAWSPDGQIVAASDYGSSASLIWWNTQTGELLHSALYEKSYKIASNDFSFSPDGSRLAVSYFEGEADTMDPTHEGSIWDVTSGELLHILQIDADNRLLKLDWSPDGRFVAATSIFIDPQGTDNVIFKVWDAETGEVISELIDSTTEKTSYAYYYAVWSPDSSKIVARDGSTVIIWDAMTGMILAKKENHDSGERYRKWDYPVQWLPIRNEILVDFTFYDADTLQAKRSIAEHQTENIYAIAFSPAEDILAVGYQHDIVLIKDGAFLDYPEYKVVNGTLSDDYDRILHSIAFSPDRSRLAAAYGTRSWEGQVVVWDRLTGEQLLLDESEEQGFYHIQWSPGGNRLAAAGGKGLLFYDGVSLEHVSVIDDPHGTMSWSPDGWLIASQVEDYLITSIFDWGTSLDYIFEAKPVETSITTIAWSPNGTKIAYGTEYNWQDGNEGLIFIVDARTGETLKILIAHEQSITGLVWSPDNKVLFSSSGTSPYNDYLKSSGWGDGAVLAWDTTTWQIIHSFGGHTAEVQGLAINADGTILASGGADGLVFFWDVSDLK